MKARNGGYDLFVCSSQGEVKGKTERNKKKKVTERGKK